MNMPTVLTISALGRAECRRTDGSIVRFPTRHCLLALVILTIQRCSRSELAELLWPFADQASQRKSLRAVLPTVRRALGASALIEEGEFISLPLGAVEVDAWNLCHHEEYEGDFLPGFDQDWVIEKRLEIRQLAYESALSCAKTDWANGSCDSALNLVKRAMSIDPLQDEAAQLRVAWLEELGQRGAALTVADAHRGKVLRELGSLSPVCPSVEPQEVHPLLSAAEWMLKFNPESLIPFLASTHNEWLELPVHAALEIHDRALEATAGNTADRSFVQAQRIVLLVQAGQLGAHRQDAELFLQNAIRTGEHLTAARLAGALSYGYLSLGEFKQSLHYADMAVECAGRVSDPIVRFESDYLHIIISGHVGRTEESFAKMLGWIEKIDLVPTAMLQAGVFVSTVEALLSAGQVDRASRNLDHARRVFSLAGATRQEAWLNISDALVFSAVGDHTGAIDSLKKTITSGRRFAGHSAISMAEDRLAQAYCSMRDFDLAAESFVRSARIRQKLGTVPSIPEREFIGRTQFVLHEKLGPQALNSAFNR